MNSSFSFFLADDSFFTWKVGMLQKIREILNRRYMLSAEETMTLPPMMPHQQRTLLRRLLRRFESSQSAEKDWVAEQKLGSSW